MTDISLVRSSENEPPSAGVTGSLPWITILCKFSDIAVEPKNLAFFQGMYANTSPGLDHFWREQSYNIANVAGSNASGWFVLPEVEAHYEHTNPEGLNHLATDCISAADSSVNFSLYTDGGINMMFNFDWYNGWAWGGSWTGTLDGVTQSWRTTWEPPWAYDDISVIQHEMGHGFGLPHSSYNTSLVYDNVWDVMSDDRYNCTAATDPIYGCIGQHTISYHKDMLGWISAGEKYTYSMGGPVTITLEKLALSSTTEDYKLAPIPIDGSSTHFYTVEARQLAGYDNKLPGAAIVIHEVNTTHEIPAIVIDDDGNGITRDNGAMWIVGETFADPTNEVSVHVNSATTSGFRVTISDGNIEDIIGRNLVLGNAGTVDVVVQALEDGEYKVRVWDDDGISNPQWDWNWTESGIITLQGGERHTFTFYTTPTSTNESFEFWLYRKDFLGFYKIIEKIEYPLTASATPPRSTPIPTVTGHNNDNRSCYNDLCHVQRGYGRFHLHQRDSDG